MLEAAKALFTARGVDNVTIAEIADAADVSASGVYAQFKSKEGVLRALVEGAMFGDRYRSALARLDAVTDPVARLLTTAAIARAIYEGESTEVGLLRGVAALSPALRRLEQDFEDMRYRLQQERVEGLFAAGLAKEGLTLDEARRILWTYTSRDVYRMLVQEGGFTLDRYQAWLARAISDALVGFDGQAGFRKDPD